MRAIIAVGLLLLCAASSANELCAKTEAAPPTEMGKSLYSAYRAKGLHLHSFTSWSGEDFYAIDVSNPAGKLFAINEVYWGSSCRVTRKLYVFGTEMEILGYYSGLSTRPQAKDIQSLVPPAELHFDGESYEWQPF